ncbi:MAG: hypothetical protein D6741_21460, partial [Planctomycetota bacterium]
MPKAFDPKYVLRHVSNRLLRDLFARHRLDTEPTVPWDTLTETRIEPIFSAWQAAPEAQRRAVEIVLHEVADMATEYGGIQAVAEEANRQGNTPLLDDLERWDNRYDKALWTYLHAPQVWERAVLFARADSLSRGRYWIKRCDLPAVEPRVDREVVEDLERAVSGFFRELQARGRYCRIEHYVRDGGVHYFFAYLDDYADTYLTLGTDGTFDRRPERRAFEVVFAYDPAHGTLEVYALGGKKVYVPLQELFCRIVLGEHIDPATSNSHPYELNRLLDRNFSFATDPRDGITSVRVRKLRLSVVGRPRRRITFEGDPNGPEKDVYDMLEEYLVRNQVPGALFDVTCVGLQFEFDRSIERLPRSMSFELSRPNSSNLKSKPEHPRRLAEKYLRQWGLDR